MPCSREILALFFAAVCGIIRKKGGGNLKHIRIAQIGTGHAHAAAAFAALKFHSDIFEIVGVAEPVPGRVETTLRKKTYEGYPVYTAEELLTMPDLDAVTVETDELYLSRYALMAAERAFMFIWISPAALSRMNSKSWWKRQDGMGAFSTWAICIATTPALWSCCSR